MAKKKKSKGGKGKGQGKGKGKGKGAGRKGGHRLLRLIAAGGLFGFAALVLLLSYFCYDLPSVEEVRPLEVRPGIAVLAADGTLIARYGGVRVEHVALSDLPPYVGHAVLAIEDRRFYSHPGIDLLGLARAMSANARAGRWAQGGSTLTQQLAKNLFLSPDKTLRRKAQEALMALWIERRFSKDEILEAYLNRVYFGSGAYGIDAAARAYFGKRAADLDLWEGAMLAGLLKAPSRFSPSANPRLAEERAKIVLRAMREAGYITADMEKTALRGGRVRPQAAEPGELARYFADWVVSQIDGYAGGFGGDIVVRTTFDTRLQRMAEEKAAALFAQLKPEDRISQMALVTLAKDGAVLAMIGGRDFSASQFNRATQARRQPGSAFKPFVFLAALEAGFSPSDTVLDEKFTSGKYRPENYEGKYYGVVTLADALAFSLNTATVRLLADVGVPRLLDVAKRAGFGGKFVPELATGLGAGEVSLLELANAYAIIGNGGYGVWPYAVASIETGDGALLYRRDGAEFSRVFASGDISGLDRMLEQVVARGTGQAAQLPRGHVAGKTGTSQNYRDAWFVGYTDRLVTGIWMGNDDDTPMHRVSGGKYPARLWGEYMREAIEVEVPPFRAGLFSGGGWAGDDAFSRMIGRWSSGRGDGGFAGDNRPVYNR